MTAWHAVQIEKQAASAGLGPGLVLTWIGDGAWSVRLERSEGNLHVY